MVTDVTGADAVLSVVGSKLTPEIFWFIFGFGKLTPDIFWFIFGFGKLTPEIILLTFVILFGKSKISRELDIFENLN